MTEIRIVDGFPAAAGGALPSWCQAGQFFLKIEIYGLAVAAQDAARV
jgi:hypothetical protein